MPRANENVEVYIAKRDFESVVFPERKEFVAAIGRVWCRGVKETHFMPSVIIRDIRAGEKLGNYSCTLQKATLN